MTSLRGKRILFRVDGSKEIGLGHIFRTRALAWRLKKVGCEVAALTLHDPISIRLLEEVGVACIPFHLSQYADVRVRTWLDFQPDMVVFDILEVAAEELLSLQAASQAKIVTVDDTGSGLRLANAVINPIVFHWGKYSVEQVESRLYEGPAYMVLQDEILRHRAFPRPHEELGSNVLVALGGTDTHDFSEAVLQALNSVRLPLMVRLNLGPGSLLSPHLLRACEESPHTITCLDAPASLISEFWSADLVICGGGIMLYELAALGIPAAAIATESHELQNIQYWVHLGTALALGSVTSFNPMLAGQEVSRLLDSFERRRAMAHSGRTIVDGEGAERILSIFAELLT